MLWLVLVLALFVITQGKTEDRVVNLDQGPVRGYLSSKGNYFEFYGIPYATAPKGGAKFKAPLEPPTWTSILDAVDDQIVCPQEVSPQGIPFKFEGKGQEDCLIANVFVPKTNVKHISVLAYVHGGGFCLGSGLMMGAETLLKHNIIFVSFNYRLGTQGYVCLGTKDIPGNAGMKDQVAALRWIKRNIGKFGGNPDDITIAGTSAGSASVELLMLSPMTTGLFNRVISESGSAISPWSTNPDPIAMAKRYMKDISNNAFEDIKDIEEFYKSLSIEQLTSKNYLAEPDSTLVHAVCVETAIEGHESFLTESPLDILKSGIYNKVPYMTGFASEEGIFRIELFNYWKNMMESNFSIFLPQDLVFKNEIEKKVVADKVRKFYFKEDAISEDKISAYVDYFTDVMFGYSALKSAKLHAQNSVPVYLYEYSYYSSNYMPHAHSDKIKGASHAAQSMSIYNIVFFKDTQLTDEDVLMRNRLTKMWTEFVKYGVPIRETSDLLPATWKAMDPSTINYLSMDVEMTPKDGLLGDRYMFWDQIYKQYYRNPAQPGITAGFTIVRNAL